MPVWDVYNKVTRRVQCVSTWGRTRSTVRSEMEEASSLPPTTAIPVQRAWPLQPPSVTPNGSRTAASAMVAIWARGEGGE